MTKHLVSESQHWLEKAREHAEQAKKSRDPDCWTWTNGIVTPPPARQAEQPQPAKSTKWRDALDAKFGKPAVDAELLRRGEFNGAPVDEHNRAVVALHETCHATQGDAIGLPVRGLAATLDKSGYCNADFSTLTGRDWREQLLRFASFMLAGIVGEEIKFGKRQTYDSTEDGDEARLAKIVKIFFADDAGKAKFYEEARALARKTLTERWSEVEAVAAALRTRGRLSGEEFRALLKPAMQVRRAQMPLMVRNADNAIAYGANDDLQVTWTTGAAVKRVDDSGRSYYEVLELGPKNVRLDRLNNGAPFLNSHDSSSLQSILGVVVKNSVRIENGQRGIATIKLSNRPDVAGVVGDLRDGIVRGISVGYRYYKVERSTESVDNIPIWRVTDWEPLEISATAIQADAGASVRSGQKFDCEVRG